MDNWPTYDQIHRSRLTRSWGVKFDLAYDGGGRGTWTQYYRTKLGARISMFWHKEVASWGGSAVLFKNPDKEN